MGMGKWETKALQIIYVSGPIYVVGFGAEPELATQLWGASKEAGSWRTGFSIWTSWEFCNSTRWEARRTLFPLGAVDLLLQGKPLVRALPG